MDMDVCSEFCQATRRCPSATSVFTTVRRLTMDCQDCIREECGELCDDVWFSKAP